MKSYKKPAHEDVVPESCYVDHAAISSRYYDRHFTATYTPHGIHQMEIGFREAIWDCQTTTEIEGIKVQIRKNRHLHPRIKKKLLAEVALVAKPDSEIYHDMKDYSLQYPRRLTQQGIRMIDSGFSKRIMANPSDEEAVRLKSEI